MKFIYLTLLTILLNACAISLDEYGRPGRMFYPKPLFLSNLPQGDDKYSQGFRDGCYNFIGQNGYGMARLYDRPINPIYITDDLYQEGYRHGDRYCGIYINKNIIL